MLGKYWRLRGINETGQTMTVADGAIIEVRLTPWKFVAGVLTYGTTIEEDLGQTATIADGAETEGDVVDNTSNVYLFVLGTAEITHDLDAAVGQYRIYYEQCDDNVNWPSDASDFKIANLKQVAIIEIDNSAVDKSQSVNLEF